MISTRYFPLWSPPASRSFPNAVRNPPGLFAWIIDCEGNRAELWEPAGGGSENDRA
jgi:hypothetical protein